MVTDTAEKTLKKTNEFGTYEIRMESIGGQGANLAGKILAEAGILEMGLNGVNFANYGSEKKGTPVKSFIRFSEGDREIRLGSPVVEPHLLVIFAETLAKAVPIMMGVKPGTIVIVNTPKSPDEIRDSLKIPGGTTLITVDAIKIAVEEKVRINTTILGAIARTGQSVTKEALEAQIRKTFQKKYPMLVEPNIKGFNRGYEELTITEIPDDGKYPAVPFTPFQPALGWKTAPIGGVITNPGNTVLHDMTASRSGFIPVHHPEKCINCAECDTTCPDQCVIFTAKVDEKDGKTKQFFSHIDLQYCKGCLRCVESCPKEALTGERE